MMPVAVASAHGQSGDPRIAEAQRRGPPPVRVDGGVRDPLEGRAREDCCPAARSDFSMRRFTARALSWNSARLGRRALHPRSRGASITLSIRSARSSLRYCLTRECLQDRLRTTPPVSAPITGRSTAVRKVP